MADTILKEMILDAPDQVAQLDLSISQLTTQISELQDKQNSLKEMCDKASQNLESHLLNKYTPPIEDYYMYTFGNYNQSLLVGGNLTDWKLYSNMMIIDATSTSTIEFILSGDQTAIFINDKDLSFIVDSENRVYSTVFSSSYDNGNDETTVEINDAVLDTLYPEIWEMKYSYTPGDDFVVDNLKSDWDFANDYITQPIGVNGTYGTQDNIAKLTIALNILTSNKTKYNNSITILEPYV